METFGVSLELARRVEMAEAEAAVECANRINSETDAAAAVEPIAGGYAIYTGAESPVTQAVALGFDGEVSAADIDRLENFYFSRHEPVRVETCPLAHPSLFALLGNRGYSVTEFSSVMARAVERAGQNGNTMPYPAGIQIRRVAGAELDLWTNTVAQGFAEQYPVTPELLNVVRVFSTGKSAECYLALVDGKAAGGATLAFRGRVAGMFGASTLPEFRGRGVQTALLEVRMQRAAEVGCDLAVSLARPGSVSERNILRRGFRVLYTRVKFERGVPA